ncbi:MAG: hypothetical protein IJ198_08215 [Lachnospiraceae bacterium]|nr:hypothetical protein [Lachnospiraceae bacterium]
MKTSTSKSSVITQISLSLVAIVLSYLLLFSKTMQVTTICQFLCGGLVAVGIISIISYFLSGDYKRIDRYGFALGTMLVLMGIIGLIRIPDLTANFEIYTGLLSMILGVLVLQGTVQIKVLDYPVWILNLILTFICIAGAICVLLEARFITDRLQGFSNWTLLACGACCLFSMLMTWICIILAGRRDKKAAESKDSDAEQKPVSGVTAEPTVQPSPAVVTPSEPAAPTAPAEPAETHHTAFDPAQDMESDVPPIESPHLTYGEEGHHSSFDNNNNN